jgi:hypothetical protein
LTVHARGVSPSENASRDPSGERLSTKYSAGAASSGVACPEGYEASFLALGGNPLDDWRNIRRIRLRFKQGVEVY